MTILEAITRADSLRHNTFTQAEKIGWLAQVDGQLFRDLVQTHEQEQTGPMGCYDEQTPMDQQLLAPSPYDELYLHYLFAQMDYYHGEYDRYNRSMGMYQAVLSAFTNFYNRTHRPTGHRFRYF